MGKKSQLSARKGSNVSPNISNRTRVNAALADFKAGNTKKSIAKQRRVSVTLLNINIENTAFKKVMRAQFGTSSFQQGGLTRLRLLLKSWLNPSKLRKLRSSVSILNACTQKKRKVYFNKLKPMRSLPCQNSRRQLGLARAFNHTAMRRSSAQSHTQNGHWLSWTGEILSVSLQHISPV